MKIWLTRLSISPIQMSERHSYLENVNHKWKSVQPIQHNTITRDLRFTLVMWSRIDLFTQQAQTKNFKLLKSSSQTELNNSHTCSIRNKADQFRHKYIKMDNIASSKQFRNVHNFQIVNCCYLIKYQYTNCVIIYTAKFWQIVVGVDSTIEEHASLSNISRNTQHTYIHTYVC